MLVFVWLVLLAAGCGRGSEPTAVAPTEGPRSTERPEPTATSVGETAEAVPVCPPAHGAGTVDPALSIYSITFAVNGAEQVVGEERWLRAAPGDEVRVSRVEMCVGPFSGNGGEACVDVAPADRSGREIMAEHRGTHLVRVTPGLITLSDLDFTWTVGEEWGGFNAVLNHWTPEETQDLDCAEGRCEQDDRIVIEFR
jgi:hypothetical protein